MRTIGVLVAAAGTAVISSPVALPSAIVAIGGYLIIGSAVATAVSQAAIPSISANKKEKNGRKQFNNWGK